MGTITVRLGADDERLLDELAEVHGDRSAAVRAAIRLLAGQDRRDRALDALIEHWEHEEGPVDEALVAEYGRRFGS